MRGILLGTLLAAALIAVRLTAPIHLNANDQGKSAQYVLYAYRTGELAVPLEKGHILPTKPPLPTWLGLLACKAAGAAADMPLRIPMAAAGVLLVLLTGLLARRVAPHPVPLLACIVLAGNYMFLKSATIVRPDMILAVTVAGAVYCAVRAFEGGRASGLLCFLCLGLGVLAKGPVAIVVFALAVVPWRLLAGDRASLRKLPVFTGALVLLAVVAAWAVPAYLSRGRELVQVMIVDEFTRHAGGRGQPIYNYLVTFPGRFIPWVIFLPAGLALAWRARTRGKGWPEGLGLCWFVFPFLAFSLVGTKRTDYLLPVVPAAAIMTASSLLACRRTLQVVLLALTGALLLVLAASFFLGPSGIADLLPMRKPRHFVAAAEIIGNYSLIAATVAGATVICGLGWFAARKGRPALAAMALFGLFLGGTAVTYHGLPGLDPNYLETRSFAERSLAIADSQGRDVIVHDGIHSGANALLFYLGKAEPTVNSLCLRRMLAFGGAALVATTPEGEEALRADGFHTERLITSNQVPGKLDYLLIGVRAK